MGRQQTKNRHKLEPTTGNFCENDSKLFLLNLVNVLTHKDNNILDLMLTNDIDLISGLRTEDNVKFTDHKLIICDVDFHYEEVKIDNDKVIDYMTTVPLYNWRNGSV